MDGWEALDWYVLYLLGVCSGIEAAYVCHCEVGVLCYLSSVFILIMTLLVLLRFIEL